MKPLPKLFPARMWSGVLWSLCLLCFDQARAGQPLPAAEPQSSPQTAVQADVGCRDQGLGISFTEGGARLRCEFQRLEGEATGAGLWLVSTMTDQPDDRFQIKAATVASQELQPAGRVTVADGVVRFLRPGLVEEYTVSMDGVRQDFVVLERPECRASGLEPVGQGNNVPSRRTALQLGLAVTGARVERSTDGVELVLEKSGRRIAYNRLLVTDAAGTELRARMEVADNSSMSLAVMVDDTDAQYPIRIDPTFSDANWVSMGGIRGANGAVRAVAVDGSGNLYIGGEFTAVGDVVASYVAKWDGNSWSALGSGVSGGFPTAVVTALAVSGDDVYVGGRFAMAGGGAANYIAKWDGSSWSALGGGMDGEVHALAVSGSDLYAGGSFMTAGGNPASRIAKWNGSSWSALGSGIGITEADGSSVSALAVSETGLYAGGYFTTAGGNPASYIARWNGSDWSALGEGLDNTVSALAVSGGDLYAGGRFAMAGEAPANHIAKWNGSTWSALGEGVDGDVSALAVSGGDLYAGGGFVAAGGSPASRIAKWNGSSWSALESGMESFSVSALAVSGSDLYAGGGFSTAGGTLAMFIAKWNGSNWGALSSEANNGSGVWALAATDGDVYAGGEFTTAGGTPANYIAKWDGSRWSALGSGMNRSVQALAVAGDDLYAGGWFSMADGIPVNHIAKWDGNSWSALGEGVNNWVNALAVSGSDVYVGGNFTTAGGSPANYVARWDGNHWHALGLGLDGMVDALAVSGNDLYVGGWFSMAGGSPAKRIAKWDGNQWSPLGAGRVGVVKALAVLGSDLYVGDTSGIAKWDGSRWSALGSGVGGSVYALAVSGSELYAGGSLVGKVGGTLVNNIAKWDGSHWSALGSGVNNWVAALTVSGSQLYVGGTFTMAGGKVSASMARAYLESPVLSQDRSAPGVTLSWPTFYESFVLQQNADTANPDTWSNADFPVTIEGHTKRVTVPHMSDRQFFRLKGD